VRYAELARKLRRLGLEVYRQGKGGHEFWWWPETNKRTSIPRHPRREIATGTLSKILKDLGLTRSDLDR
jgi:predicted RNA binding protein YcfA (HicA-like mRNA interferase family)